MTVIVKNKLVQNGITIGYAVCVDGIENRYSVHDAVKLVHTAAHSNVIIVCNKYIKMRTNDNHIKARLRHSHLRLKLGRLQIVAVND